MKAVTANRAQESKPPLTSRILAEAEGCSISEYKCCCGPQDRSFEERHERFTIAAVVEGSFQYRSDTGKALLYPGSFLLGNVNACFECGHEHGTGDRCIAFHFAPALFEEIASSSAGSYRFRFPVGMLPPSRELTKSFVEIESLARSATAMATDELALRLAEEVIRTMTDASESTSLAAKDERRISAVLRYIEENADQPLNLDVLARTAVMSKYHFLRTFRRVAGLTPYEFVLGIRMRRAATQLRVTEKSVATIAFDAGFGDLSTFNKRFREVIGASPIRFKRRQGAI